MKALLNFKCLVLSLLFIVASCNKENKEQHPELTYEDFEQIVPYIQLHGIYYRLDATAAKHDGVSDDLIKEAKKSLEQTNDYLDKEIETFKNEEKNIASYQIGLRDFKAKKSFSKDSTNSQQPTHTIVLSREERHQRNYTNTTTLEDIDTLYVGDVHQFKH